MRICHRFALGGFAATALLSSAPLGSGEAAGQHTAGKPQLPNAYIENRGQWDAQAQFLAKAPGVNVWITTTGVVYDFYKTVKKPGFDQRNPTPDTLPTKKGHVVRMEFVGATPSAVKGEGVASSPYNYLLGNDKSKWVRGVPGFEAVRAEQVYEGVAARYYFDGGMPRYDLIVAPGADPGKIAMRFEGAKRLSVKDGALEIGTSIGEARHQGLFAFQRSPQGIKQVPCAITTTGNVARFEIGAYDKARPLIIDPLIMGTFVGGSGGDFVKAMDVNAAGKATCTGYTLSTNFPTTPGAYDSSHNGGDWDAFLFKLNAFGVSLQMCTYVGGSGNDWGAGVAVDESGNTFAAINTFSSNFPTTAGAYDTTYDNLDVAVLKLDLDSNLVFSTFVGASGQDTAEDLVLFGNKPVVVGNTSSPNFPTTLNAFQAAALGGVKDGFVFNLDATGSNLPHSTYLGGSGEDFAMKIRRRNDNEWVIAGRTSSTNFPTTVGAFDATHNGGTDDVFLCRMDTTFTTLIKSTYVGGLASDVPGGLACPGTGQDIFVAGTTESGNFPTTAGAFNPTPNSAAADCMVFRINPGLSSLTFSTYLGGNSEDQAFGIGVDQWSNSIIAGTTFSNNFPTSGSKAFDFSYNGVNDAFVFKMDPTGSGMVYSTFLGAEQADSALALEVDPAGNTFLAGSTTSPFFPRVAGSYDTEHNGAEDVFVSKLGTAPSLFDMSFASSVVGGFKTPLTVFIDQNAPSGGAPVTIGTTNHGKVFVPATITVREGNDSRTASVGTESVTVDTNVTVFATCNSITQSRQITLRPGGLASVKLDATMPKNTVGTGFVNLTGAAPSGGRTVTLSSSNPAKLMVPANTVVPTSQTMADFSVTAANVSSNTNVTVLAKLGAMTKADTITILP